VYKVNLGVEAEVKQCKAQLEKCNKSNDIKSYDAWHSDTLNLNHLANQLTAIDRDIEHTIRIQR